MSVSFTLNFDKNKMLKDLGWNEELEQIASEYEKCNTIDLESLNSLRCEAKRIREMKID